MARNGLETTNIAQNNSFYHHLFVLIISGFFYQNYFLKYFLTNMLWYHGICVGLIQYTLNYHYMIVYKDGGKQSLIDECNFPESKILELFLGTWLAMMVGYGWWWLMSIAMDATHRLHAARFIARCIDNSFSVPPGTNYSGKHSICVTYHRKSDLDLLHGGASCSMRSQST